MAVEINLTTDLGAAASIDFVNRFGTRLNSLAELLGQFRMLPVQSGSVIRTYTSTVTLAGNPIAPGEIIPLSEVVMAEADSFELAWNKYRKAVTMEDIQKYGFERAIARTDNALLGEIQKGVRGSLFGILAEGTGVVSGTNLQEVLAYNWAAVQTVFDEDEPELISFMNPNDAAEYLANANITTQTAFGMTYLENFLNNRVVFMHGSIPEGTVYSTAADNLVLAYVDMNGGDVARTFEFTVDESGLIGVTHDINKQRLQAETIAAYGLVLFPERVDGVVVGTIAAGV